MASKPTLPYAKVQTFEYGDDVFLKEEDCIRAVVTNIVDNPGLALTVLTNAEELLPVLNRYVALQAATAATLA